MVESRPVVEEVNQVYRPPHATKVSFQDARMEKLDIIPSSSANLVQVLEVGDLLLKSKKKEDRESYVVLTRGRRGSEELTPALGEVRPNTYVLPHLTELEKVVNDAHNMINEDNMINRESFPRVIPEILVSPKVKQSDRRSLSHKIASSNPYDVWDELSHLNANISVAQLMEVSPIIKKAIQKGVARRRRTRSNPITLVARTDVKVDPGPVLVEVSIVDKVVPFCLVDGGSAVNIMPWSTMEKLGLKLSGPSTVNITMADQRNVRPEGVIKKLEVSTGGEVYELDFQVLLIWRPQPVLPFVVGSAVVKTFKCGYGLGEGLYYVWKPRQPYEGEN